jgi:hypothetical protein
MTLQRQLNWLKRLCICTTFATSSLGIGINVGSGVAKGQDWEPDPTTQATAKLIDEQTQRAHIRFLADDLLEGRGPASRGDQLA